MMQHGGGGVQENAHAPHSPVPPAPRPRQQPPGPPDDGGVYEPVSVEYANVVYVPPKAGGAESQRPVPAPRIRTKVVLVQETTERRVATGKGDPYQNVILRPAPVPQGKPPPPLPPPEAPSPSYNNQKPTSSGPSRAAVAGNDAPPTVPPLPGKVNNDLHGARGASAETDAVAVEGTSDSSPAQEGGGGRTESKYKTSSPADLFKSIGTTTRMLTEAIGERVAHKTKKAAHNVRNTGSSLVSWGTKSRPGAKGGGAQETGVEGADANQRPPTATPSPPAARPNTLSSPEMLQKIQFGSPLPLNNAVSLQDGVGGGDTPPDACQMTYDIPRRGNKLSNLAHAPDSPSTTAPSTAPSSARASSSSMASSGAGATGLFQRNAPASQSLYSRVLPKSARRYGSPSERTTTATPEQQGLVRSSKNKSESNLHESTFFVDRSVASGSTSGTHLYGKLNIIARPSLSSTSSGSSTHDITAGKVVTGDAMDGGAGSDDDNNLPELLRTGVQLRDPQSTSPSASNRATYRSSASPGAKRAIFSRRISPSELPVFRAPAPADGERQPHRSESWNFYDIAGSPAAQTLDEEDGDDADGDEEGLSYCSTPEPLYVNDERRPAPTAIPIYDQLSEMESLGVLMKPLPVGMGALRRHDYDEVSIADIIDEFDPLAQGAGATLEAIIENNAFRDGGGAPVDGNLTLIESLLGAESYSRRRVVPRRFQAPLLEANEVDGERPASADATEPTLEATESGESAAARARIPKPPMRSDSLLVADTAEADPPARSLPVKPKRQKRPDSSATGRQTVSVIVHQNLNLPSSSVENLVELDEWVIEPHLATVDDGASGAAAGGPVDLSYSKGPQTSWYLEEDGGAGATGDARFEKQLHVDPTNVHGSHVAGRADKAAKSSLPPELAGPSGSQSQSVASSAPAEPTGETENDPVPSYFEAIGGTDPLFERGLAAAAPPPKSTSVAAKLLNVLKRRPSFNRDQGTVRAALEMVPKPRLTERLISHKGHVLKFPSGKIGDVLNELSPRSVVLRERIFQTFLDPQQTLPKESIQLRFIMSVQCILQHKFAGEGRLDLHCFEIVLAMPKDGGGGGGGGASGGFSAGAMAAAGMSATSPDLLITSATSGNVKLARQSYMFGTHKRSDRNLWMAKVLQSVTDVFGGEGELLREFLRAGWCYVKKSVSAGWAGAWLLLAKRRLYLYSNAEGRLEELDLRKARCIGVIDNEPGSIGNLHVEVGPSLFIDCPPYATLYFIMGSPRETQIWHKVVRQAAHKNGPTLHSQQLTRGDVPVLIDKCINFIYAHGSMSEGIYRKSGSLSSVARILQLFGEDAFDVQLTRAEYNEYDVAGALKKFVRELPGSFFGSYAASFVAIGSLSGGDVQLKVDSYRQLLERLPRIEYCTLKKLIGHLAFIASLEKHNRMGVPNLAMIWGSTLLTNASQNMVQEPGSYHQQDADVVADLIRLYRRLFPVGEDELRKDQLMLSVLQKYHAAAENLSDAVKHSGDLKVWISIDCDSPPDGGTTPSAASAAPEDKPQINVDITPVKMASDVCKELAGKTKYPWYKLTLYEVIADGALIRPIHYSEKVLEIVVRWTYWAEADRKNNYLTLKPTTTLNDVYRTIQKAPVLTPTMELKFADRKTKNLRSFQLQLIGRGLVVLKKIEKKDKGFEELMKIDLSRMTAYIGCEPKRDRSSLRWAITLVDHDFKKRTRDAPFIGHIFGGLDYASQILWYSSILYSHHKDDILPSGDLFF